jgi:hypothetical protein
MIRDEFNFLVTVNFPNKPAVRRVGRGSDTSREKEGTKELISF